MNSLSASATAIFNRLLLLNQSKIDNNETFMPLHFEFLYETADGKFYSLAHYFVQNGDLMADPEMTFLRINEKIILPATYRLDSLGKYQDCYQYDDNGRINGVYLALQKQLAFC